MTTARNFSRKFAEHPLELSPEIASRYFPCHQGLLPLHRENREVPRQGMPMKRQATKQGEDGYRNKKANDFQGSFAIVVRRRIIRKEEGLAKSPHLAVKIYGGRRELHSLVH